MSPDVKYENLVTLAFLAFGQPLCRTSQMPVDSQPDTLRLVEALGKSLPSRGRVYILPHNYPDPDALAAAAGMQLLLAKRFGLSGHILFTGVVSRAENREMLRQIRTKWSTTSQETQPSREVPCVLVDTSPWSGNVTIPKFTRPVAMIDHHPGRRKRAPSKDLFMDIRVGAGATCTIVHEYLTACEIQIPKWLGTVMAYAIASETLDLSRDCAEGDLRAYVKLLSRANLGNLGRIRHAPLPRSYYGNLSEAMQNAQVYGRVAWTYLPSVQMPEIVAEVADLLHRMERITWAFCVANMKGRMLISIRSSDPRARCGSLLKKIVGKGGSAGGHHHMAAGYVNVENLSEKTRESRRDELIQKLAIAIEKRSARKSHGECEPIVAQPLIETSPEANEED